MASKTTAATRDNGNSAEVSTQKKNNKKTRLRVQTRLREKVA
jgi:hypothetical protein